MDLTTDIENFQKEMLPSIPQDILKIMVAATETLVASGVADHARKVGDSAPLFTLNNSDGTTVALSDLLQQGPVILNFYRGAWCPYCNLELKAWQRCLPQLQTLGATLVSITPNLQKKNAEFVSNNPFSFNILSDPNNQIAKAYGLVFTLPEELRPIYHNFGIDLSEYDGNTDDQLPMPATYLIGRDGTIMQAFVHADYTQRMEPAEVMAFLQHKEKPMNNTIFSPITMGKRSISNRIVMAPLTRNRAPQGLATPLMVEYYTQRATAGLIITEGAQISQQAVGYPATPGIYNANQVASWRQLTDAVHHKGGRIFVQLWHCGRISHPDFHQGALPVAPSAVQPAGEAITLEGMQPFVTPRALDSDEIEGIVAQYRHAASCAMEAGFDGIEIHAANGYLIDQFLRDRTNQRQDQYGGTIENRCRLLLEVTQAVGEAIGLNRVGIRISPINRFNDIADSDPQALFNHIAKSLGALNAAYLHVVEVTMTGEVDQAVDMQQIRTLFGGIYIANGGYDKARGNTAIAEGSADMIAYGVPFLANPDLPQRFQQNAPLNTPDPSTFYGGDGHGYTDYPPLATS